ncbi:MAG: hypothetical protein OHK0029_35860 [Armatimonadaceae bacterium]
MERSTLNTQSSSRRVFSGRALLLGLLGAAFVSAIQVYTKAGSHVTPLPFSSTLTLMTGAVFLLFLLALLNSLLRRYAPRVALQPAELAIIYGLTTVGASIAAHDEVQFLLPMHVFFFRDSQADRAGEFCRFIPEWMVPQTDEILKPYQLGNDWFWQPQYLVAWAVPLLCWMAWLSVLGAVMWAWNILLRKRWVDHDRLSFPCIQMPLEMCREGGFGGMVGGRMFWIAFGISALIESQNQLTKLIPAFPGITLDLDATPILNGMDAPWKALAPMYMMWSTVHIGICYLIPTDILFSSWFFYVLRKASEVWGYAMGWRELGWDARGFPYTRAQSTGAWAMLFFLLLWAERKRLGRILSVAFGLSREKLDDDDEPASYRLAAWVLVLGSAFLVGWSVLSGMSLKLALIYYGFFWILTVTMTRIYAQVGPPILELYFLDPQKALTSAFGTFGESSGSLTQFSLMYWINRDHRGQPMAHQLAAIHMTRSTGANDRRFAPWIIVAFAIGALTCLLTYLHLAYLLGEDRWIPPGHQQAGGGAAVSRLIEWTGKKPGPQWIEVGFMTFGAAFAALLAKINTTMIGTPFHPIGYALAVCFAVEYNWPAFLGVWLVKVLLLRYGGRSLFLRFIPAAFGLTLGGLVVPVFWGFLSFVAGWER